MDRLRGQCRWFLMVIVLFTVGQLSTIASADPLLADANLVAPLELAWIPSPISVGPVPSDVAEPSSPVSPVIVPDEFRSWDDPAPGLQVSINPDDEEVFLGWRFVF